MHELFHEPSPAERGARRRVARACAYRVAVLFALCLPAGCAIESAAPAAPSMTPAVSTATSPVASPVVAPASLPAVEIVSPPPGVKQQLAVFSGASGGYLECFAGTEQLQPPELRAVAGECVAEISDELNVRFHDVETAAASAMVTRPDGRRDQHVLDEAGSDGVLKLYFAPGDPLGEWAIDVDTGRGTLQAGLTLRAATRPAVVVRPEPASDAQRVDLAGFEPGTDVDLTLYWWPSAVAYAFSTGVVFADYAGSLGTVTVDERGEGAAAVAEVSGLPWGYYLVVSDPRVAIEEGLYPNEFRTGDSSTAWLDRRSPPPDGVAARLELPPAAGEPCHGGTVTAGSTRQLPPAELASRVRLCWSGFDPDAPLEIVWSAPVDPAIEPLIVDDPASRPRLELLREGLEFYRQTHSGSFSISTDSTGRAEHEWKLGVADSDSTNSAGGRGLYRFEARQGQLTAAATLELGATTAPQILLGDTPWQLLVSFAGFRPRQRVPIHVYAPSADAAACASDRECWQYIASNMNLRVDAAGSAGYTFWAPIGESVAPVPLLVRAEVAPGSFLDRRYEPSAAPSGSGSAPAGLYDLRRDDRGRL